MIAAATALYLLDTNAISHAIKQPHGLVATRMSSLLPGQAVISAIVEGELRYGIEKTSASNVERRLNAVLVRLPTLDVTAAVALEYGNIRAELERQGSPIGMNDLWIAAHARALNLTVVTDNENEFRRVPGLKLENWQR